MTELIAVITITILAVISPGADFAMVTRNSYLHGRFSGLLSALGISLGVQVHVIYTMLGVGLLISHSPTLFVIVKIIGSAYLIYIGFMTVKSVLQKNEITQEKSHLSGWVSFRMGFYTNALNPKTMLFVLSVFTQFVSQDTEFFVLVGYGVFMSLLHLVWFGIIAVFFSNSMLRNLMLNHQRSVNNVLGSILIFLGISLLLAPLAVT